MYFLVESIATAFLALLLIHSLFIDPTANLDSFKEKCTKNEKFVAIGPNYSRLGNQLYHLASGYCIAKNINRIFYYPLKKGKRGLLLQQYLNLILKAFPRTDERSTYHMTTRQNERGVRAGVSRCSVMHRWLKVAECELSSCSPIFAQQLHSSEHGCCSSKLIGHPEKFVFLDFKYAQNARYLKGCLSELRNLFAFSDSVKQLGERDLASLDVGKSTDFLCIHTRRTDFLQFDIESDMNGTLKAAERIAELHKLNNFLIFGDDQEFMSTMASNIVTKSTSNAKRTAYISTFSEMSDFYISSRLCRSFLLSAASSTMGWWLAFFAREQDAVYYYKDGRGMNDYKMSHDEFQLAFGGLISEQISDRMHALHTKMKSWHRYDG